MTTWTPPTNNQRIAVSEIIVVSPASVMIDGIDCGKLCDAMANMPQFASQFQIALEDAWNLHLTSLTANSED